MNRYLIMAAVLATALGATAPAVADHPTRSEQPKAEQGKQEHPKAEHPKQAHDVIGMLFFADWCAACKELEPKLDAVRRGYAERPIRFTRVDLTDDAAKEQSARRAEEAGLSAVYAKHADKTGFVLLIDARTKKVLDRLVATQTADEMRTTIDGALAAAHAARQAKSEDQHGGEHPQREGGTR
jgi:thiol-disulfide isomerase/thioredoxin